MTLLDFRERRVCYGSFFYGGFTAAALVLGLTLEASSARIFSAVVFLIAAKLFHESLPLKSSDAPSVRNDNDSGARPVPQNPLP